MTACVFVTISMQLEHLNMKSPLVYDLSVALYCVVCVGAGECVWYVWMYVCVVCVGAGECV